MRTIVCMATLLVACSSHSRSTANDGAAGDAVADAGTLDFTWTAVIATICTGNEPLAQCPVTAEVFVSSPSTLPAPIVTVNGQNASSSGSSLYVAHVTSPLEPTYRVVITVGTETLARTLTSPADYTLTVTPAMPAPNTAATLTWTPANDPVVQYAAVFVGGPSTPFSGYGNDTGTLAFPANTFPSAGSYTLDFNRREFLMDAPGVTGTAPNVQLARELTIDVQ
jgi:hypothetical protein